MTTLISSRPEAKTEVAAPNTTKHFRRLKPDELVSHGDYVADGRSGFALWEGPGGFRADSFVKPIYRKQPHRPNAARKSQ